jgi:hypothetical protein
MGIFHFLCAIGLHKYDLVATDLLLDRNKALPFMCKPYIHKYRCKRCGHEHYVFMQLRRVLWKGDGVSPEIADRFKKFEETKV